MSDEGHDRGLETMFSEIDKHAAPLTSELMDLLRKRNSELSRRKKDQRSADDQFLETTLVPHWDGLAHVGRKSAKQVERQAFLDEWNSTLQTIRNIGATISDKKVRPSWIGDDVPLGAQADQFLHAYYYNEVIGERGRSNYEALFTANRDDPDAAVTEAMKIWKRLPSSSHENRTLNKVAPELRKAFARKNLARLTEDQFVTVLGVSMPPANTPAA